MYESFFGLSQRPFVAAPQVDRYFAASTVHEAVSTLTRCIERAEGPGLIIGPPGIGKTLVCQTLAAAFRDSMDVALLSAGRLSTRRALLQAILYELGQEYRGLDEGECRLALVDYLSNQESSPQGMLLLVDEAHTLPLRLLEELRMLTNLVRNEKARVHVVFSGAGVLEERLTHPKLESLSQRLTARCYLEPLNRAETTEYVRAQLAAVGGDAEQIFSEEAFESIYQASDGIPRLINQVCDHALMMAYALDHKRLEHADVEEAWADLQRLPTPWSETSNDGDSGGGVVEFGALDSEETQATELVETSGENSQVTLEFPQSTTPEPNVEFERLAETAEIPVDQRLDEITAAVSDLDEEFQPAGCIVPQVELQFEQAPDPFAEPFAEEEVVIDHYAALDAHGWQSFPEVTSLEGRELARLMQPYTALPPPQLTIARLAEGEAAAQTPAEPAEQVAASGANEIAAEHRADETIPTHVGDQSERTEPAVAAAMEDADAQHDAGVEGPFEIHQPQRVPAPAATAETISPRMLTNRDDDLIVIEDVPEQAPAARRPAARRMEYRQLFARLRSG